MDVPQACSQSLQRAELKLLHRTLGASQLAGDLANGLLLDEALHDDTLLVAGQASDQLGEQGTAVDVGEVPSSAGSGDGAARSRAARCQPSVTASRAICISHAMKGTPRHSKRPR
jgi:hypothetical protein